MARYFGQSLAKEGHPPTPSVEALIGMQPLERSRAEAAMRAQDKVVPQSRRIHMRTGVDGADAWLVPNTDVSPGGSHPDRDVARAICRSEFDVSPGCTLRAACLHVPSGMTQHIPASVYVAAGVQGVVQFVTTWTASDATTESYTYVMPLDGSQLEFGSENTSAGGMQKSLRLAEVKMIPPVDFSDNAERDKWSRPYSVDVEIRYVGSPRVVDLVVYERPNFFTPEADRADTEWVQHVFAIGDPDDAAPKTKWPVDEREDTGAGDRDQRHGTLQCLRVVENQRKRLGPMLIHWNAYREGEGAVTDTALPFLTIGTAASVRWSNLLNLFQTSNTRSSIAFEPDEPAWSMGCGGYARQWLHNNRQVVPTQNVAAVPVLLRILADNQAAATNTTVRLHTAPDNADASASDCAEAYSWIECVIPAATGGSPAWHEAWGYVTVGLNPEQHVVAQLMVQQETSGTDVDFYAVQAYVWDGTYAPVA